jgi:preprotein translocase subunit SecE
MATRAKATEKKPGGSKFFRGVWTELKKVNWPSRQEIVSYVGIVLFMCTLTAVLLGTFDTLFQGLIAQFL